MTQPKAPFLVLLEQRVAQLSPPAQAVPPGASAASIQAFREGLISLEELNGELKMLGWAGLPLGRLLLVATRQRSTALALERLNAGRQLLRRSKISREEFMLQALKLGFASDLVLQVANIEVALQVAAPARSTTIGLRLVVPPAGQVEERERRSTTIGLVLRSPAGSGVQAPKPRPTTVGLRFNLPS